MATPSATWDYRERFGDRFARTFFRRFEDCVVSSVGVGTYLGDATDDADDAYEAAIAEALSSGVNVVDTAINYRHQRSERVVGRALADAGVDREAVLVATKGGFVPFDGDRPEDPGEFVRETYVEPGIVDRDDLVRGQHCIAPGFLDEQIDRSLSNLDVETIDLYYVHNPETQLEARSREAVYEQLEAAFVALERRVEAGDVRHYGVATWEALRVEPGNDAFLSLAEIQARAAAAAERVGHETDHLAAIQLPFNVAMADAFTLEGQPSPADDPVEDRPAGDESDGAVTPDDAARTSALWYAFDADLHVFTSATLLQGQLADGLPAAVSAEIDGETAAQRAINFARSAPGVTCALVGTGSSEHAAENVAAGTHEPLGATAFDAIFE